MVAPSRNLRNPRNPLLPRKLTERRYDAQAFRSAVYSLAYDEPLAGGLGGDGVVVVDDLGEQVGGAICRRGFAPTLPDRPPSGSPRRC
jgi:hypothetical protein